MIVGISIHNFKAIREIKNLPLDEFHVLVGPNASGKSTFLDAIDFVRDCLILGPYEATEKRDIPDFNDMTWQRKGGATHIEIWLDLSDSQPELGEYRFRYTLEIEQDSDMGIYVKGEELRRYSIHSLSKSNPCKPNRGSKGEELVKKTSGGNYNYVREKENYRDSFNFGLDRLALANVPPDEKRYPTANAVRKFLTHGVRYIQIDSRSMRQPCSVKQPTVLNMEGTNLARVVGALVAEKNGFVPHWATVDSRIAEWIDHLRYALPNLDNIGWAKREADNAEYLVLRYKDKDVSFSLLRDGKERLEVPSWLLSDGTLRTLALTLPAFLPPEPAIYMVEEPENGVHPKALEIILQSLSYVPRAQMLLTTHSPLVVQEFDTKPLLCFSHSEQGTQITSGATSAFLKRWKEEWECRPDIGTLFANGMLK